MQTNLNEDGSVRAMDRSSGALFRVDPDGKTSQHTEREFGLSNSMAWSADGRTFYFGDSIRNVIFAYDWHGDEGVITNRRVYFEGFERGVPDGSTIDAQGCMWNARFGGSCLVRVTPKGIVDQIVETPVSNPTSCTFGGAGQRTLFVTSATFGLSEQQLADNALEGCILQADTDTAGIADHRFG